VAVAVAQEFQGLVAQAVLVAAAQEERKLLVELLVLPTQAVAVAGKVVVLEAQQLAVLVVQALLFSQSQQQDIQARQQDHLQLPHPVQIQF
jgi:hypothetical protein